MKKILLFFALLIAGFGSPAFAQTLFIEGGSHAVCNPSGGGSNCNLFNTGPGIYAQNNAIATEKGWATANASLLDLEARKNALIAAKPVSGAWVVGVSMDAYDISNNIGKAGDPWSTPTAYANALLNYTQSLRDAGAKVALETFKPTTNSTYNTRRNAINLIIRQNAGVKYDILIDSGNDKYMGPDANASDTVYYLDGVNPTGTGYQRLAWLYKWRINEAITGAAQWSDSSTTINITNTAWTNPVVTPPAFEREPNDMDQIGYTRSQWLSSGGLTYTNTGEAKFRLTCSDNGTFFKFDPILFPGVPNVGHLHTRIGNFAGNQSAQFSVLRSQPGSACSGGPLNSTFYWASTVMKEIKTGVYVPVKLNATSFYYTTDWNNGPNLRRIPNEFMFILGAKPGDRFNTTIQAAWTAAPGGWDTTDRHNGWMGWQCIPDVGTATVAGGSTADVNPLTGMPRQLKNADLSDPWGGTCTKGYFVINIVAPSCWDGKNFTSPDGRSHVAYPARKVDSSITGKCPDSHPFKIPHFEVKEEVAHNGWADYSKWFLSSDRMDPNPVNWEPDGSTMHADWLGAWDRVIMSTWNSKCNGMDIPGFTPTIQMTCGNSTISGTQRMFVLESPPVAGLSFDPVIIIHNRNNEPSKQKYGPIATATTLNANVGSTHH